MADMAEAVRSIVESMPPLDDTVFRKFLEDEENFRLLAELILEEEMPCGEILVVEGERVLSVNGKRIRMDNFRTTPSGSVNMEAQRDARDFTFKRHLFYWAIAYSSPLRKGQRYEVLQPAASIVLYEDKGDACIIEEAALSGQLVQPGGNLLRMVAVNCAKWKDASNDRLRQCLAVMHNGVYSDKTADLFEGIDTDSDFFKSLNSGIRIAASEIKYIEYREKGDNEMVEGITKYWSKEREEKAFSEGMARGEAKGEAKGESKGKAEGKAEGMAKVITLWESGYSVDDIKKMMRREYGESVLGDSPPTH